MEYSDQAGQRGDADPRDNAEHQNYVGNPDNGERPDHTEQINSLSRSRMGSRGSRRARYSRGREGDEGRRDSEDGSSFEDVSRRIVRLIDQYDTLKDALDLRALIDATENPILPDYRNFVLRRADNAEARPELDRIMGLIQKRPGLGYDDREAWQLAAVTIETLKKTIVDQENQVHQRIKELKDEVRSKQEIIENLRRSEHDKAQVVRFKMRVIDALEKENKALVDREKGWLNQIQHLTAKKEYLLDDNQYLEERVEVAESTTNGEAERESPSQTWRSLAPNAQSRWMQFLISQTGERDTALFLENAIHSVNQLSRGLMHRTVETMQLRPDYLDRNLVTNTTVIQQVEVDTAETESNSPDRRSFAHEQHHESERSSETESPTHTGTVHSNAVEQNVSVDPGTAHIQDSDSGEFQDALSDQQLLSGVARSMTPSSASTAFESALSNLDYTASADSLNQTHTSLNDTLDTLAAFLTRRFPRLIKTWLQLNEWQLLHALLLILCIYLTVGVFQVQRKWYTANTSIMRERITSWREDYWDLRCLQHLRWYVQMAIERQAGGKGYIPLT